MYLYSTCASPKLERFSIGNLLPRPPGREGRGSNGVVVVTSTIRYSSGNGRANFVNVLP